MAVMDRTVSSLQLAGRWKTATGNRCVIETTIRRRLLHRGLRARVHFYKFPSLHKDISAYSNNEFIDMGTGMDTCQKVVFSDELHFNSRYSDGRSRVRRYSGERHPTS